MEADDDGWPVAVYLSGRRHAVEAVLESWRIDEEWWRKRPVSRAYFRLLLEDGRTITLYQNLTTSQWSRQIY